MFLNADFLVPGVDLFNYALTGTYKAELLLSSGRSIAHIDPLPLVDERNFGTLVATRLEPGSRKYELRLDIRGERLRRTLTLRYDLDVSRKATVEYTSNIPV